MRHISYDFSSLNNIFAEVATKNEMSDDNIRNIKRELNNFFNDSHCNDVYFSNNTSKPFFGIIVAPKINANYIYELLMDDNGDSRIEEYSIEFDSKLFDPIMDLSPREITALVLHSVGSVVNDSTPIDNVRKYLDEYMARNNETLKMSDSVHYREILAYAVKDFIMKDRSAFYTNDIDAVLADEFVVAYGFGNALEGAMKKILATNVKLYQGQFDERFFTFCWCMRLYRHMRYRRIPAIKTLNNALALTGSRIEKAEIENMIRRITRIDDTALLESSNGLISKIKARMRKLRIDNLKAIEEDYYEFNMRIRNVEDEDDALYIMRQINARISIIADFIETEDLNPSEKKRWQDLLDRFKRLREELSNTMVYKKKNYGIFVSYPDIQTDRY